MKNKEKLRGVMKYLIALIFLALPTYLIRFSIAGIPTTALEILIYIIFLFGLGLMGYSQWSKVKSAVWLPVGLLLLACIIAVLVSPLKSDALGQFKAFFIDPLLVLWLMLAYLKVKDFSYVFLGLAGSGLIVSVYSTVQKLFGQVTPDGRVVGIFGYSPNYVALFLAPVTVLIILYAINLKNQKIITWFLAGLSILNLMAIYLSGSRAGLIAVLAGVGVYFILKHWRFFRERIWAKYSLVAAALLIIVMAWFVFKPDFSVSPEDGGRVASSNNIRWQIWQTSFELGFKKPVTGVGLANFQNSFKELTNNRVNFPEFISPLALTPHNVFLMFWLSTGLLGIITFVWVLVIFYRMAWKYRLNKQAIILFSVMTALLIQGLVDTPYFKNDLSILFWGIIGLVLVMDKGEK